MVRPNSSSLLVLVLLLVTSAAGGQAQQYDDTVLARASKLETELRDVVKPEFRDTAPLSARVPVADTRLGAELLGGNLQNLMLYIAYLHYQGVERTSYRFSYPIFSEPMLRIVEYRYVFREMARAAHDDGNAVTAVVGAHRLDNNYYVGIPDFDVCEDIVDRAVDTAIHAQRVLQPDWLLLDFSPTTLRMSPGCEAFVDDAAALTLAMVERLRDDVRNIGIVVNLADEDEYLDSAASSDANLVAFATHDSIFDGPDALLSALSDASNRVRTMDPDKKLAVSQFWLTKLDPGHGTIANLSGGPSTVSDAADIWANVDRLVGALARQLESSDDYEFVSVYEPDFVFGFGVEASKLMPVDPSNGFDRFRNMSLVDRMTARRNAKRKIADTARSLRQSAATSSVN